LNEAESKMLYFFSRNTGFTPFTHRTTMDKFIVCV